MNDVLKYIQEGSFFKIISVPVILTGIGVLIVNIYLDQYNLSDYNLLKPRAIFTGFVFTLIVIIYSIFLLLFLFTDDISSNSVYHLIINFICKPLVWIPVFYLLFMNGFQGKNEYSLWSLTFSANRIKVLSMLPFFLFIIFFMNWRYVHSPKTKIDFLYRWFFRLVVPLSLILEGFCFILMYKNESSFRDTTYFFCYITLSVGLYFIGMWATITDNKNGIETSSGLFSAELSYGKLDYLLQYCWFATLALIVTFNYANKIYPQMSEVVGGGRANKSTICAKNGNEYHGTIVNEDVNQYYLVDKNRNVFILQHNDIEYFFNDARN